MVFVQHGFRGEQFQLTGTTGHKHEDHIFGFGGQQAGASRHGAVSGDGIACEQICECDGAE